MLDSLVARARFYDITGYWIPGNIALGIVWLYAKVFGWADTANNILLFVGDHWIASSILIFAAGGYAMGHLVNSISELLIEKVVFAIPYQKKANWLKRIQERNGDKEKEVIKRFHDKFNYVPTSYIATGPVIQGWAEQNLPAPSMTTFRFLCFYGMNRTLAILTLAMIPPAAYWVLVHSHFCCMVVTILAGVFIVGMFIYQYLRFVEYYANSIPELLLMEVTADSKKGEHD